MSAGKYSMLCEQGATFILPITYKNEDGTPVNLNGYTGRMQVRRSAFDEEVLVTLTTENGRITLGTEGSITLTIDADTTEGFDAGQYVYDLELVSGTYVTRVIEGIFTVSGEVTRTEAA